MTFLNMLNEFGGFRHIFQSFTYHLQGQGVAACVQMMITLLLPTCIDRHYR